MGNTWRKKVSTKFDHVISILSPWADTDIEDVSSDSEYEPPPLRIVERKAWDPKKPKYKQLLKLPVKNYVLRYFTNTDPCEGDEECFERLRELQDKHMAEGYPDIAYNFLVGDDGTVYEGRGWKVKPTKVDWQAMKYNGKSIDIALFGDYKTSYPPDAMQEAVCRLMTRGSLQGYVETDWELTEYRKEIPTGHWTHNDFGPDTDEKIYDADTEPPPEIPK